MKIFYSPRCLEYSQPGHPESPSRARHTYEYLEAQGYEFVEPSSCKDEDILLAHSQKLLDSVKKGSFFDFDTPAYPGIFDIAMLSAGSAVDAMLHCLNSEEKAFSLMRPAIASIKAQKEVPTVNRVAIVDFDCHHGNGTEDIMLGKKDFLYLSLHQSPLYPGTGLKSRDNCINLPVSSSTGPDQYISLFKEGLKQIEQFNPDLLAVSAGFDSYKLDPITSLTLELPTYREIGMLLARLKKPAFAILEGGYSRDLPECIFEFLQGIEE
jgi:acetoin utilization deacetylase AcuC-like enzyme